MTALLLAICESLAGIFYSEHVETKLGNHCEFIRDCSEHRNTN